MRIIASRPPAGASDGKAGGKADGKADGKAPVPHSAQARLTLALAGGKAAGSAARVLRVGGGTSFPGIVARRIDPHVLQKATAASDARKAVVAGRKSATKKARKSSE